VTIKVKAVSLPHDKKMCNVTHLEEEAWRGEENSCKRGGASCSRICVSAGVTSFAETWTHFLEKTREERGNIIGEYGVPFEPSRRVVYGGGGVAAVGRRKNQRAGSSKGKRIMDYAFSSNDNDDNEKDLIDGLLFGKSMVSMS
jgi:hypothetical protein